MNVARTTGLAPSPEPSGARYQELDSLRGLAAAVVVLHHCAYVMYAGSFTSFRLSLLLPGSSAVDLFFVLSGFVLTLPFLRDRSMDYRAYLAKRFCRLYLPYAAALLFAIAGALTCPHVVTGNGWFDQTWNRVTLRSALYHFTGIGTFFAPQYNTAFWTLVIEMRVSLIMPFLAWFAARTRLMPGLLGSLAVSIALNQVLGHSWLATAQWACLFFNGSLLAVHLPELQAKWNNLPTAMQRICGSAAILTFSASHTGHALRCLPLAQLDWLTGAAAMVIIIMVIEIPWMRRWMHRPQMLRLGTISYSVYLVHGTILFWLINTFWRHFPILLLLISAFLLSFAAAHIFHRIIEAPTIELSRRVGRLLRPELTRA